MAGKYLNNMDYPFNMIWEFSPKLEDEDLFTTVPTSDDNTSIKEEVFLILAKEFTKLQDRTVKIILSRYHDKLKYAEIGEKYNLSKSRVREIIMYGLRKIRYRIYSLKYLILGRYFEQVSAEMIRSKEVGLSSTAINHTYMRAIGYTYMSTVDERTLMYGEPPFLKQLVWLVLEEEIRKVNGDMESLNVSEIVDRMHQHIHYKKIMDIGVLNYVYEKEHEDIKMKTEKNTDIGNVGFSLRTYRSLYNYGICTLGDIIKYTKEDLEKIRNLDVKGIEEIEEVLTKHGLELLPKECENLDEMPLEKLELSSRPFCILMRNNIQTIGDLRNADIEELRKLHGMGEKSIAEIIDKLEGLKR
ncbi:MAG: hypothetical protein IKU29_01935 [Parabacteroides sp.]|nr:hypothetical protein [Parabacteroides sp.]